MPRICSFDGIAISMYYDEIQHRGRPHFHAYYAGVTASFDIDDLSLIVGVLPPYGKRLVVEWAREHQVELRDNWRRARAHLPLLPIEPLR